MKKFTKKMFCKSRYINRLWLFYCKNLERTTLKELEEIADMYRNELIGLFWDLDTWDDIENQYIKEEYRNYSILELKELLECLYMLYKKHVKNDWCAKGAVAEFIQNWMLEDDEEGKKIKEKIKKNREFQKYLLKIMLEWLENISRNNRYRLSRWISILYKIVGKKLPKIWSLDYYNLGKFEFYEYWEKYVDEYLKEKWIDGVLKEVFDEE